MAHFFLAHAKSVEGDALTALVATAHRVLARFAKGKPYTVTTGRDHFVERFKAAGSWAAWTQEVATGIDYATRAPTFTAILVPVGPIGAGTAQIVRAAVAAGRPVFAFNAAGDAVRVVGVRLVNANDWQAGTRLVCERAIDA